MDSDRDINMHKVLFLIFFLGVLFISQKGSFATSKIYQGLFACEVKKITVVQVKEGIPKIYNSLEGGHVEGDIFGIEYSYNYVYANEMKFGNLRDEDRGKFIILNWGKFKKTDFENTTGMIFAYDGDKITSGVSSDKVSIYGMVGDIFLERYYKRDWHGIMTKTHNNSTQETLAIDCIHKEDQLDEIIEEAKERLRNQ